MIPHFETKAEFLTFFNDELKGDKMRLTRLKKSAIKYADAMAYNYASPKSSDEVVKSLGVGNIDADVKSITAKVVINTTNILDSHGDVHVKGIWNKSLKENQNIYHLQEHKQSFSNVISDEVIATAKTFTWKQLGYDFDGSTQALVFESKIDDSTNPYMFGLYKSNKVKNHSVGMQYVKVDLAVNSTDKYWADEKALFDEMIDEIANKETAIERGMFWVVREAKVIEGSAVLIGSNRATPTIGITEATDKGTSTIIEPSDDTQKNTSYLDIAKQILLTNKQKI